MYAHIYAYMHICICICVMRCGACWLAVAQCSVGCGVLPVRCWGARLRRIKRNYIRAKKTKKINNRIRKRTYVRGAGGSPAAPAADRGWRMARWSARLPVPRSGWGCGAEMRARARAHKYFACASARPPSPLAPRRERV